MIHEKVALFSGKDVTLTTCIHDEFDTMAQKNRHPAIINLLGGVFEFLSPTESDPLALTFMQKRFNTFVLDYTVGDGCHYPDVMIECSKAIQTVGE